MHVKIQVLVGLALGVLLVVAFDVASAGEQSPTLALPEVEMAPAAVVAAGADSIDVNAVGRLTTYGPMIRRGTAFQLDDGRIATVAHALVDARRASFGTDPLPIRDEAGNSVVAISRLHDLGSVRGMVLPATLAVSPIPGAVGQQVALAGYPADGRLTTVAGEIISRTSGVDYGIGRPDVLVIDAPVEQGFSGGPVVDADGNVIGIIVGREERSGVTIAVPVEYLPDP